MAKIHSLEIKKFRGIKSFKETFWNHDFICFVGRGDTGKTSILEAISFVLYPNYNLTFYDTDFYNCDIDESIEITAVLYDLPQEFIQVEKYGLAVQFINKNSGELIENELEDNSLLCLKIRLRVDKDLEPQWRIINFVDEEKEIRASDRAKLNIFLVSDYLNQHFSWNKGNPLYALYKQEEMSSEKDSTILDALREAKNNIDEAEFSYLKPVIEKVKANSTNFGLDLNNPKTSIDFKDIIIKDGRICLHEDKIPFRLKGKGSKRLISIAIQLALAKFGGIVLIDEIEQGLEPDRVKHLARTLYCENKLNNGQVFITTHSQNVIVELECENLYLLTNNNGEVTGKFILPDDKYQKLVRACPEALYANKVIVCEGKTELGICRSLDNFLRTNNNSSLASKDIVYTLGQGNSMIERVKTLLSLEKEVCLFCDSDENNANKSKKELNSLGIKIIDWASGKSVEKQIFDDLDWGSICRILNYIYSFANIEFINALKSEIPAGIILKDWLKEEASDKRSIISKIVSKKGYLKRIDHGYKIGNIIFESFNKLENTTLKTKLDELLAWINNNEH